MVFNEEPLVACIQESRTEISENGKYLCFNAVAATCEQGRKKVNASILVRKDVVYV